MIIDKASRKNVSNGASIQSKTVPYGYAGTVLRTNKVEMTAKLTLFETRNENTKLQVLKVTWKN